MAPKTRQLTCRFFRILAVKDGEVTPVQDVAWPAVLSKWGERPYTERRVELSTGVHVFEPRPGASSRSLAIHRLKDDQEFLSQLDEQGIVTEVMAIDENGRVFADSSCVAFLPYGNIFGLVRANQAAPMAAKVADWINEVRIFGDQKITVQPMVVPADAGWKERSTGASKLSAYVPIEVLDGLAAHLGGAEQTFSDDMPDARVNITISYGNRRPAGKAGEAMLRAVNFLADRLSGVGHNASASASVYEEVKVPGKEKDQTKTRLLKQTVELVEYEVASTFDLPETTGGVKIDLTLQHIEAAAQRDASALRRALEAGGDYDAQGVVDGTSEE